MTTTLGFGYNDYLASERIRTKPKRISNFKTAIKYFLRSQGVSEQEIKSDLEGSLDKIPLSALPT